MQSLSKCQVPEVPSIARVDSLSAKVQLPMGSSQHAGAANLDQQKRPSADSKTQERSFKKKTKKPVAKQQERPTDFDVARSVTFKPQRNISDVIAENNVD